MTSELRKKVWYICTSQLPYIKYQPKENKMAEGLITDCRLLLSRFENHKSVRFETFCEVWREMNFSLIHWYVRIFSMNFLSWHFGLHFSRSMTLSCTTSIDLLRSRTLYVHAKISMMHAKFSQLNNLMKRSILIPFRRFTTFHSDLK